MNLNTVLPSIKPAWETYTGCIKHLWWPLSFLLLTPLAVLIVFGAIIPLGLESIGLINFNYRILNGIYILLVAALIYCSLFPFIDGLYRVIRSYLQKECIDENTGFQNISDSKKMGIALAPVLIALILMTVLGTFIKPLGLITLFIYICTVFTPILCINDNDGLMPVKKSLESFQLTIKNKKLVKDIWIVRLLIILSFIIPIKIIALLGNYPVLHLLSILVAIPLLIFTLIRIFPFYFFYPAYVYHKVSN